ncbi:hypothetical protein STEG23_008873 [Scotinomys teguina]
MEPAELQNELVSAEGRNRKAVLCQRCGSRVLQPGTALFSRRQLFLPTMRKKPVLVDGGSPDGDFLQEHWLVNDMFILRMWASPRTWTTSTFWSVRTVKSDPLAGIA